MCEREELENPEPSKTVSFSNSFKKIYSRKDGNLIWRI